MNYVLFDGEAHRKLLPFTFTRPVAEIRIGILTIREKWEKASQCHNFNAYGNVSFREISTGKSTGKCIYQCVFFTKSRIDSINTWIKKQSGLFFTDRSL